MAVRIRVKVCRRGLGLQPGQGCTSAMSTHSIGLQQNINTIGLLHISCQVRHR